MNSKLKILACVVALMLGSAAYAGDNHKDDHDHQEDAHEHEEADKTQISSDIAKEMKIETALAQAGVIKTTMSLTGNVVLNQNKMANIRARFAGPVRGLNKSVGDKVRKGETIATIESNESLQAYSVTSPLDGIVMQRNVSVGDIADTEHLYVIADLSSLWAEFQVFAGDVTRVKEQQNITVKNISGDQNVETVLTYILPTADNISQTVIARADLDNQDNLWRPGMIIRGDVVLQERDVDIAVRTSAIQRQEGNLVVYVLHDDVYEARKVTIGESNQDWTEITSGLSDGERYVAENSFIVKADIAKSEAEHAH